MKKIMFVLMMISIGSFAMTQKLNSKNVPAAVKASFAKLYPGIKTTWEKEAGKYEAGFKKNGVTMSVLFDATGTVAETEMDIKVASLPAAVLAYVKEHYKGKSIKEASKITKADGTINYETQVGGKDVIFDVNGNFIKEAKE